MTFNLESQGDKEEEQTIAQQEFGQNAEDPPYSIPLIQEAVADADEAADVPSSLPLTRRTSESEGTEPEKGLKRKLADRGTSQGPESPPVTTTSAEAVKRPRDDGDKDDNPRISKKQSPPPEQREKSPSDETTTPKFVGFRYLSMHQHTHHYHRGALWHMPLQRLHLHLSKDRRFSLAHLAAIKSRSHQYLRHQHRLPFPFFLATVHRPGPRSPGPHLQPYLNNPHGSKHHRARPPNARALKRSQDRLRPLPLRSLTLDQSLRAITRVHWRVASLPLVGSIWQAFFPHMLAVVARHSSSPVPNVQGLILRAVDRPGAPWKANKVR